MAVSLTHTTVAVGTEQGNGEIGKDEWNENHTITLASGKLLGRTTAGDGEVEEIDISDFATAAHDHDSDYAPLSHDHDSDYAPLSHDHDSDYVELAGDTMTGTLTMNAGANLALSNTTNANQFGIVTKGGTRFIHDFNYGNNGTVTTNGRNLFIGENAGNLTMGSTATNAAHSSDNVAVGHQALAGLTIGASNVGIGYQAGYSVTTGSTLAIGNWACRNNTTASNVGIGNYANYAATTTTGNTAIGHGALWNGSLCTAVGTSAGTNNSATGVENTYIGNSAGNKTSTGSYNTMVGRNAGFENTTGYSNLYIGKQSGYSGVSAYYNSAIGEFAVYLNRIGSGITGIGRNTLYNVGKRTTAGAFLTGYSYTIVSAGTTDFTAIGAANNNVGTTFTATGAGTGTGTADPVTSYSIAFGDSSCYDLIHGNYNVVVGPGSASGLTNGHGNTVIGAKLAVPSDGISGNILIGNCSSNGTGAIKAQFDGNDWWFSGSIGYATGQGGTVTQDTSRTNGVTINKNCGAITLVSAAGSTSWQSFTVTNSEVAATDTIIVNQKSGTDKYMIHVTAVGAGSFEITYATTGGTTTEQPVFNFSVLKAVAA